MGTVVAAGLAALAIVVLGPRGNASRSPDEAQVAPIASAVVVPDPVSSTGVVEVVRELAQDRESGTRRFELSIRMRDGTLRVSDEVGEARWRAGDRVLLIGSPASR